MTITDAPLRPASPRRSRLALALALVTTIALAGLWGCAASPFSIAGFGDDGPGVREREVDLGAFATRSRRHVIEIDGTAVRVRNLVGRTEIVPGGAAGMVTVEAAVYARGANADATDALLEHMVWTTAGDEAGRSAWTLDYPVEAFDRFHYPRFGRGQSADVTWHGRKLKISGRTGPESVTVFADVRIVVPPGVALAVEGAAGRLTAADVRATLDLDVAVGDIRLGAVEGGLAARAGAGDVRVAAVTGPLEVHTGAGDVIVAGVDGEATIRSGAGDVRVQGAAGPGLTVETGAGDVHVVARAVRRVEAKSGAGDIHLDVTFAEAEAILATSGVGDVIVSGEPDAAFDLHADTGLGDVRIRYGIDALPGRSRRTVRGEAGPRVTLHSGVGDCIVGPR